MMELRSFGAKTSMTSSSSGKGWARITPEAAAALDGVTLEQEDILLQHYGARPF
jgi:hypothetical protein